MRIADLNRETCPKEGIDISGVPFYRTTRRYGAKIESAPAVSLEVAFMGNNPYIFTQDYKVAYSLVHMGQTPGGDPAIEKMSVFALLNYSQAIETQRGKHPESITGTVEIDKDSLGLASRLVKMHRDIINEAGEPNPWVYDRPERDICTKLADYVLSQLEQIDILNHPELSTF